MKLLVIFIISFFSLFLSPNSILAQADPLENPDQPCMDSGDGRCYAPPTNKKTSDEIFEDFLNIFFGGLGKSTNDSDNENNGGNSENTNTRPSPSIYITQSPDNLETPSLPEGSSQKDFASLIASLVHQDCISEGIGIVTKKNTTLSESLRNLPSCLTRVQNIMNSAGIAEIHSSVTAFYYVQCVACARAMADASNKPYEGYGNAKQHINQAVSGYRYVPNLGTNSNELVPGSLGISNEGAYGHIYYISEVYRDASGRVTHYLALECNYGGQGYLRHDIKRSVTQKIKGTNTFYLAGWQKPI